MKDDDDTNPTKPVPVFDQLPADLQDAWLDVLATALLNQALAELDDHDTVVVTTERKAG